MPDEEWAYLQGEHFSQVQCKMIKNSTSKPKPCLVYRSGLWAGKWLEITLRSHSNSREKINVTGYFYQLQNTFLNYQSYFINPDTDGECVGDMGCQIMSMEIDILQSTQSAALPAHLSLRENSANTTFVTPPFGTGWPPTRHSKLFANYFAN